MTSQVIVIREGSLAEEALGHSFDFNLWFQEQLHSTPWWMASIIFHVLLILVLASIPTPEKIELPPYIVTNDIKPDIDKDVETMPQIRPATPLTPEKTNSTEIDQVPVDNPTDTQDESFDPTLLDVKYGNDTTGIGGTFGNPRGGGGPGGPGGSKTTENQTVLAALKWLARHQNRDGSWGAKAFQHQCRVSKCIGTGDDQFDNGLTGLALLAFTGAG